jgi:DNA-binding CsgD family transcriptional regulator
MVFVLAPILAPLANLPSVTAPDRFQMLQIAVEGLADGLMLLTPNGDVVEANLRAHQICYHLHQASESTNPSQFNSAASLPLPAALWQNCQQLLAQNELRLGQTSLPEFELMLNQTTALRVRVRWLEVIGKAHPEVDPESHHNRPYLLLTIEERDRSTSDILKYELSEREIQVWKLRMQGYSYQAIANKLYITINTVKKHMKNILAKQRLLSTTNI